MGTPYPRWPGLDVAQQTAAHAHHGDLWGKRAMTQSQPKPLRRVLTDRTIRATGFGIGFALTFAAGAAIYSDAFDGITDTSSPSSPTSSQPSREARLAERHGCWTGPAPEGAIPGHALVSLPGARAALVPADAGFAIWLGPDGSPGTGDEAVGTLHAFCP